MPVTDATKKAMESAVKAERRVIAKRLRGIAASKNNWLSADARRALRDAAAEISKGAI